MENETMCSDGGNAIAITHAMCGKIVFICEYHLYFMKVKGQNE